MSEDDTRFTLNIDWINSFGFQELSEPQRNVLLNAVYSALESKVGRRLTANVPDDRLDEFGAVLDYPDEAIADTAALEWMQTNMPDYGDIVRAVLNELEAEMRTIAAELSTISLEGGPADELAGVESGPQGPYSAEILTRPRHATSAPDAEADRGDLEGDEINMPSREAIDPRALVHETREGTERLR